MRSYLLLIFTFLLFKSCVFGQSDSIWLDSQLFGDAYYTEIAVSTIDGTLLSVDAVDPLDDAGVFMSLFNYRKEEVVITIINAYPDSNYIAQDYRYDCYIFPMPAKDSINVSDVLKVKGLYPELEEKTTLTITGLPAQGRIFLEEGKKRFYQNVVRIKKKKGEKSIKLPVSSNCGYRVLVSGEDGDTYKELFIKPSKGVDSRYSYKSLGECSGDINLKTPRGLRNLAVYAVNAPNDLYMIYNGRSESEYSIVSITDSRKIDKLRLEYEIFLEAYGNKRIRHEEVCSKDAIQFKKFVDIDCEYNEVGDKKYVEIYSDLVDTSSVIWSVSGKERLKPFAFRPERMNSIITSIGEDGEEENLLVVGTGVTIAEPLLKYSIIGDRHQLGKMFQLPPLVQMLDISEEAMPVLEPRSIRLQFQSDDSSGMTTFRKNILRE